MSAEQISVHIYFRAKLRLLFIYAMLYEYGEHTRNFLVLSYFYFTFYIEGVFDKIIIPLCACWICRMIIANSVRLVGYLLSHIQRAFVE